MKLKRTHSARRHLQKLTTLREQIIEQQALPALDSDSCRFGSHPGNSDSRSDEEEPPAPKMERPRSRSFFGVGVRMRPTSCLGSGELTPTATWRRSAPPPFSSRLLHDFEIDWKTRFCAAILAAGDPGTGVAGGSMST